jgi:hypothetical protein
LELKTAAEDIDGVEDCVLVVGKLDVVLAVDVTCGLVADSVVVAGDESVVFRC